MSLRFLIGAAMSVFAAPAMGWDGVDADTGADVEIESGNLVRSGRDIEIYDYETGEYHDVTIEDINRDGGGVEIEEPQAKRHSKGKPGRGGLSDRA